MERITVIIAVKDGGAVVETFGNFQKLCAARKWKYQSLSNKKIVPKIGEPVTIEGEIIHRVIFQ